VVAESASVRAASASGVATSHPASYRKAARAYDALMQTRGLDTAAAEAARQRAAAGTTNRAHVAAPPQALPAQPSHLPTANSGSAEDSRSGWQSQAHLLSHVQQLAPPLAVTSVPAPAPPQVRAAVAFSFTHRAAPAARAAPSREHAVPAPCGQGELKQRPLQRVSRWGTVANAETTRATGRGESIR
jgi:hypothetical protein